MCSVLIIHTLFLTLPIFLFRSDEGFIEPPSKKAKSGDVPPNPAASEASAPAAVPVAQISTATSLSKGRNTPSTAAAATPSSGKPVSLFLSHASFLEWTLINNPSPSICFSCFPKDLRAVISSLETFASQYTSLEADKARLQKEVKSTSSKLEGAIKIAAEARQEVDSLKVELEGLKKRLKDEKASRLAVEAWAIEKDDLLRQSSLALLSNTLSAFLLIIASQIQSFVNKLFLFRSSQRPPISLSKLWISFRTISRRTLCR